MSTADNIRSEEGWKAHVYPDSLGFATIGYGFLVDSRRGEGLPKTVAEFWLDYEIRQKVEGLTTGWEPFLTQPADVRDALAEMAYQLGVEGVLAFKYMLGALERHDRLMAAGYALDSLWAKQTPARAERVAARIRGTT